MARLSKSSSHPFTIHDDSGIPTPDSTYEPSFDDVIKGIQENDPKLGADDVKNGWDADGKPERGTGDLETDTGVVQHDGYDDIDDERRASAVTGRTSVSSLPEWTDNTDVETKPYTPPVIRPSFMRPESVRRMQMRSPPPFSPRSSRQSVLRHSRSRAGTPQSVRSAVNALGSPRSQRHISEETTQNDRAADAKLYPLILLHVTLLPVRLPWSVEAMQELLPQSTLDQLQVLKGKVSETILQRGVLIPHPREEYEMLEERLLEALELEEERLTKCGHFRGHARDSTSSISTVGDGSDSGIGSSVEGLDGDVCTVCHHGIRSAKSAGRKKKWTVKIYAANGLMRASAWAAVWSEMERVDVEILPFISEGLRKQLDARQEHDDLEEVTRRVAEDERVRAMFDEQTALEDERRKRDEDLVKDLPGHVKESLTHASPATIHKHPFDPTATDLPQIYRPSEIPLSVLVKNYLFLLAQDRRNVVIFFLTVLVLLFSMRWAASGTMTEPRQTMVSMEDACLSHQGQVGLLLPDVTTTMMDVQTNATEEEPNSVKIHEDVAEEDMKNEPPSYDDSQILSSEEETIEMRSGAEGPVSDDVHT